MRFFWLFCALGALLGCRTVAEPSGTAIALFCSTSEQSKTDILTQGDEIAVFARIEGTANCFFEAVKFTVKADGHSLMTAPAVAYPETNQAIHFFAYFPYHTGTFSVPVDQSTAGDLKAADLCGATASTTPVTTPISLEFNHLLARVVITTNKPTTKMVFPNAVASGVVHTATAELVLGTVRKDIWTTGNELIVPVQPLSRLLLTVSGVEYVFDTAPIALEAGRTTTLDLTLHPNTHTATLSGSSVTDWELAKTEGSPSQAVSNTLLLHWPSLPQGATPDQVIFTIGGTDYTVSNGITYANQTFTVPFTSQILRYPYTISNITFYQSGRLVQSCANLLGTEIYKSGHSTVGINPSAVKIGNLWWATGNLVASNAVAGARGVGGCRIGAPADGGLYFQFGSLIGYKGGDQKNGGTGGGMPQAPLTTNGAYWNGVGFSWASDAMVWPTNLAGNPTTWPQLTLGLSHQWFFSGQDITLGVINVTDATKGVGDPCGYYLGGTWRLPTVEEYVVLFDNVGNNTVWADVLHWKWDNGGAGYFESKLDSFSNKLFLPASGYRSDLNGSFDYVASIGYKWSSSVNGATYGCFLYFNGGVVYPWNYVNRSNGFPVRCVSPVS